MIDIIQAGDNILGSRPIILIIDFANVAYSGWYSKPEITKNGQNVNAVIVFFQRLRALKETFNPTFMLLAEDMGRANTFRRKMFAPYKAQRKPVDPDIEYQMDIIKSINQSLGFARLRNPIFEADDIVGMVAKWGDENGYDSIIISSDRDMYQLLTEHTYVMSPKDNQIIDLQYMEDMYQLNPKQWIDLKILQGDNADNIPGIRGIGKKTALELMQKFGSIENIYENLQYIKPHIRDVLVAGKNDIPLMRDLVTIITDYTNIELKESDLYRHDVMFDIVEDTLNKYSLAPALGIAMQWGLYPQPYDKMEVYSR